MRLPSLSSIALVVLAVPLGACRPARAAPPPAEAPPSFDPASATPYFAAGPAAEARRRFVAQDWSGAARGFGAYLEQHPRAPDRQQARFLRAIALSRSGAFAAAATELEALVVAYPLLADQHRLYAARAWAAAADEAAAPAPGGKASAGATKGTPARGARSRGGPARAGARSGVSRAAEADPAGGAARLRERALAAARAVSADSPLAAEATLVTADVLRARDGAGDREAAARLYDAYLERYPESWRASEVRLRLAQLLPPAQAARARGLYRHLYIQAPTSPQAAAARAALEAMGPAALALDGGEHLARGLALLGEMRNEAAEVELTAALEGGALDARQQCVASFHRAKSVFQQRNRPRAAPLYDEAVALCGKAQPGAGEGDKAREVADLHAKALYQAARCHAARREPGAAVARFARLEAEHPTHSYADDSRVREAEVLGDVLARLPRALPLLPAAIGAAAPAPAARSAADIAAYLEATPEAKVDAGVVRATRDALLASIADAYPGGDMAGEALFRLAFAAFEEGRLDEARRLLDKELALLPREEGWWEAGRTLYWLARVAAAQHRAADAAGLYARAVREYPLSYYALQALNRLREAAPADEKRLVEELGRPPAGPAELAWRFPPDPLYGAPAFRRGVELARLGLGTDARRELASAGLRTARKGDRPVVEADEPVRAAQLWLAAVLYDSAGEWALSHELPRYVLTDYARRWPSGDNRKRWLIAYPHGYEPLVVEHAGESGQPAALQFAIIREESGFVPDLESFANAVGLTQLTQDPARRFANGLPYSREALRDPVINITIGARELGDLWRSTGATAPLAIAGYNAGLGAVKRWLAASPDGLPADEFIERIPYDETRGYTKRVLGTWFAYHYLYEAGDPVPTLGPGLGPLARGAARPRN